MDEDEEQTRGEKERNVTKKGIPHQGISTCFNFPRATFRNESWRRGTVRPIPKKGLAV